MQMNPRFLALSATLALACTGDDSGSGQTEGADGSDTMVTTGQDGQDDQDGGEAPDDGSDTPDTGMGTVDDTGDTGSMTSDTGDDTTGGGVPACPYTAVDGDPALGFQLVADGFNRPLFALGDPAEPDRLFVVEQGGTIKILESGMTSAPSENFLSVTSTNANNAVIGAESGTLGFAFHPDWPDDPRVYVHYNPPSGDSLIEEYMGDASDDSQADVNSARTVISLDQPAGNHNGGMIAFGPDGWLYLGMGDGGGGGDQYNTSRDTDMLLAKMLRIGVEPDGTPDNPESCPSCSQLGPFDYTIPSDNPGADGTNTWAPEIFAMGLRNPWRFTIDPINGDIIAGDVGQGNWEEVSIIERAGDYGWNDMEGFHCYGGGGCDTSAGPNQVNSDGQTAPIFEYSSGGDGASITGGGVYHSCEVPAWDGIYVFGEYIEEDIHAIRWDGSSTTDLGDVPAFGEPIIGNGWNAWGDVYLTTVVGDPYGPHGTGKIYRMAPG